MSTLIDVVVVWAFMIQFPLYFLVCCKVGWRFTGILELIDLYFEEKYPL